MAEQAGPIASVEVSTDYDGNTANIGLSTWTDCGKWLKGSTQMNAPEPAEVEYGDDRVGQAGEKVKEAFAFADLANAGVTAIKTAAGAGTDIWVRFTYEDGTKYILGGSLGCQATYVEQRLVNFGEKVFALAGFTATSTSPGGVWQDDAT